MKFKIIFFLCISFLLISCQKKYEVSLNKYFKYLKNGKLAQAYELLSEKDKDVIPLDDYINQKITPISNNISKRIKYRITSSSLSQTQKAVDVKVEVMRIDILKLYSLVPDLLNESLSALEIDQIFKRDSMLLKRAYVKQIINYKLVLEKGKWRIVADYGWKKRVGELLDKAFTYYKENKYKKSFETYNMVLDFENDNPRAIDSMIEIKEKLDYIETFLDISEDILESTKKREIINVAVKNNGTIMVKKIFIDFLFYSDNEIIHKESRLLLDKDIDNHPLGYKEKIQKKFKFDNIYYDLNRVKCVVSGIEF